MKKSVLFLSLIVFVISACNSSEDKKKGNKKVALEQQVIDQSIKYYNYAQLNHIDITFDFRGTHYTFFQNGENFAYSREKVDSSEVATIDLLSQDLFERTVDSEKVEVDSEWTTKYTNSIVSVMYFAFLPYKLNDPGVNKEYLDTIRIKGKKYHKIKITFTPRENMDHPDDVYIYWFEAETGSMDYFAYEYFTGEGGLRFREAFNKRTIKDMQFQDYHNYKPNDGLNLKLEDLDQAFQYDRLKLLSEIVLDNISVQ